MKKRTTEIFIFIFTALAFSYFSTSEAGTCSSISRSSFGANTVLTSSELNSQFSTVYGAVNDLDGGCVTDGTLEATALKATDFQPVFDNIVGGCLVSYSSASQVSVSPCSATVNGNQIHKTGATTVAFGCTGCSTEIGSREYYVYIKGDSTGSTLNLLISTSVPDTLGYNGDNKVIARFYNNTSWDIDQYSIDQWVVNQFVPQITGRVNDGALTLSATGTTPTKGTVIRDTVYFERVGSYARIEFDYYRKNTGAVAGTGFYLFTLPGGLEFEESSYLAQTTYPSILDTGTAYGDLQLGGLSGGWNQGGRGLIAPYSATQFRIFSYVATDSSGTPGVSAWNAIFIQAGFYDTTQTPLIRGTVMVPIKNWTY